MGSTHARCLAGYPGVRLRAVVDRNIDDLESAGNNGVPSSKERIVRFDGVELLHELDAVLTSPDIDVVDICLPVRFHYDWTIRALEAGKHVLLEKPMVLDPEQGREIIDLARKKDRILMVAHVVRFMPAYKMLATIVKNRQMGPLELIIMQRWSGEPAWGMWKETEGRRSSGGGLFDLLIHDIDVVNSLLGKPSRILSNVLAGNISDHDVVNAVWHYENGAVAILDGGFAFHSGLSFEARFLARFSKATVAFDSSRPGVLVVAKDRDGTSMTLDADPLSGYEGEIEYFISCVQSHRWPDECSPESSVEALELALRHIPA
jgi:predicted dehydrogenase